MRKKLEITYPSGATPLNPDEIEGLIPLHISTQDELNQFEYTNILKAEFWAFNQAQLKDFLSFEFLKRLHKKMFDDVWSWAGEWRKTNKNIGVDFWQITSELTRLLQDVIYQIQQQSLSYDEIAYRFHHRLVWIHPFTNGNGRHARLMTDILLTELGEARFSWGDKNLSADGVIRQQYISALQAADKHNYSLLAKFVRS
jgi:Fic-DOC domain mobile mystery protein B